MKKKTLIIIILVILAFIAISIWTFIFYQQHNINNNTINNNDTHNETNNNETTNSNNYLTTYLCQNEYTGYDVLYFDKEKCQNEYFKIKVENPDAHFFNEEQYDYTEYVLYADNGLKLYNNYTKDSINIPLDYKVYNSFYLNADDINHNVVGIILENKEKYYSYYNLEKNIFLYDNNKFESMRPINKDYIEAATSGDLGPLTNNTYVIKANEEKEIGKILTGSCGSGIMEININGGDYFAYSSNCDMAIYDDITFYTIDNLTTLNKERKYSNEYFIDNNGNLNILEENTINIYNSKGTLLKKQNFDDKILAIYKGFYLGISNNTLSIKDYQNNVIKELGLWDTDNEFNRGISGQFNNYKITYGDDDKELYNKGKGYYFIITAKDKFYEYYYNPDNNEFYSWEFNDVIGSYSISYETERIQF